MDRDIWTLREDTIGDVDLTGFAVKAADGGIGKVTDAMYQVGSSWIVVDTGPWILGREILLPAGLIERVEIENEQLLIGRTKNEIEKATRYDASRGIDEAYRDELGAYYGEPTTSSRLHQLH